VLLLLVSLLQLSVAEAAPALSRMMTTSLEKLANAIDNFDLPTLLSVITSGVVALKARLRREDQPPPLVYARFRAAASRS